MYRQKLSLDEIEYLIGHSKVLKPSRANVFEILQQKSARNMGERNFVGRMKRIICADKKDTMIIIKMYNAQLPNVLVF